MSRDGLIWRIEQHDDPNERWTIEAGRTRGLDRIFGAFWLFMTCTTHDPVRMRIAVDCFVDYRWSLPAVERSLSQALDRFDAGYHLAAPKQLRGALLVMALFQVGVVVYDTWLLITQDVWWPIAAGFVAYAAGVAVYWWTWLRRARRFNAALANREGVDW